MPRLLPPVPVLTALLALAMLPAASATGLVDHRVQDLGTGEEMPLQQGYAVELQWMKNDLDAVGVAVNDGTPRPVDELIMERGDTRNIARNGNRILSITLRGINRSSDGEYVARLEAVQYRDPDRPYPNPVLQRKDLRVGSGEPRQLSDGYAIKASPGSDGVRVLLLKNSIPEQSYTVEEGDYVVYSRDADAGGEYTILAARADSVFEDTEGNVNVVFSTLNQYQSPESGSYLQGPAAVMTGVLVFTGLAIILFSRFSKRS